MTNRVNRRRFAIVAALLIALILLLAWLGSAPAGYGQTIPVEQGAGYYTEYLPFVEAR